MQIEFKVSLPHTESSIEDAWKMEPRNTEEDDVCDGFELVCPQTWHQNSTVYEQ